MRLLTHNFLKSTVKGTENGYPLSIEPIQVRIEPTPMDRILLTKMLTKINYDALLGALQDLKPHMAENTTSSEAKEETTAETSEECTNLPELPPQLDLPLTDESLLQALQLVLFDVHVVEGFLICPDSKRKFPIKEGIPNMILHEDEI